MVDKLYRAGDTGGPEVTAEDVVRRFLDFFQSRDHLRIPNASLIPKGDPTLLFINSGMAPLKNYFLGLETPPHPDLCNIQGCIRTKDIDDVGDRHHLTYFEMLGSWSIGRYWKPQDIALAFELLTERFGFPVDRLYATAFAGDEALGIPADEESMRVWRELGLPPDHIVPLGRDNFWGPAGELGPCGPCTEVFYDTGDAFGARYEPGGVFDTEKRYIEIWNAGVFMQYDKQPGGLVPLAIRSVDTGSGLERMVMTLNGYDSVYDVDTLRPIVDAVRDQLSGPDDRAANLIADHVRAAVFILAEGQLPSNTGAGYIPRRLIRRCVATVTQRGVNDFSFPRVLDAVFDSVRPWNAHVLDKRAAVVQAFQDEQRDFERVLGRGLERLASMSSGDSPHLSGADAFRLFATYGLPIDTIREHLRDRGGEVDEAAFTQAYEEHQVLSRQGRAASSVSSDEILASLPATEFTGYEGTEGSGHLLLLLKDGGPVESAEAGSHVQIVMDRTAFYAEGGGQIGDHGLLTAVSGTVDVEDTVKDDAGHVIHKGTVKGGNIARGDVLQQRVDVARRRGLRHHHSATHLLNGALRAVLGPHVQQAGSRVEPDRLRFDFRHAGKMTDEELRRAESLVNQYIRDNLPATVRVLPYPEAIAEGAIAMFEEKYGDRVRVMRFGDVSTELCGGTHVGATGDIGLFLLTGESSVARGVRRVTAVAGEAAVALVQDRERLLERVAAQLQCPVDKVADALDARLRVAAPKGKPDSPATPRLADLRARVQALDDGTPTLVTEVDLPPDALRESALAFAEELGGVVGLLARDGGKVHVVVTVARAKIALYDAKAILDRLVPLVNGRGGGRPHLAQGGGDNLAGVDGIMREFRRAVSGA